MNNELQNNVVLQNGIVLQNRYQVTELLGSGGFGNTYRAYDKNLGREVALKELYPKGFVNREIKTNQVVAEKGREAAFDHYKSKFFKEAKLMYDLRELPEVLDVYDVFSFGGTVYYSMQLLTGENLKEYIKRNGTMTWETIAPVLKEIIRSLRPVHERGYIHRDIKPENIFLTQQRKVYLIDYGNVRDFAHADHFTEDLTDHFAPPEQYEKHKQQGPYTDIYSLCSTLYYCMCLKLVPVAVSRKADVFANGKDPLVPLMKVNRHIPKYVSEAIQKGLKVAEKERFQTLEELEHAFFPKNIPEEAAESDSPGRTIQCISGIMEGHTFSLPREEHYSVGRIGNICYPKQAHGISRIQFYLYVDKFGYVWIYDENSTNGVFVNGEKIVQGQWKQLRQGQRISFVGEVYQLK